jgi:predicted hydrocarbon binding protein
MAANDRPTLGSFMSLTCFQYLRIGTEEVADRAPVVAAGRKRGYDLVESLGLMGSTHDASVIREKLDAALGAKGTKLCLVQAVTAKPDGGYEVRITEGACTAGQVSSQPHCAFTMGVFIGALHAITNARMTGREIQCCACGATECIYQIDPV